LNDREEGKKKYILLTNEKQNQRGCMIRCNDSSAGSFSGPKIQVLRHRQEISVCPAELQISWGQDFW